MKTLTLLRHAKAGEGDPSTRDFERPLDPLGRREAAAIGHYLRREHLRFDQVIASPALRVRRTLDEVAIAAATTFHPELDRRLYLAPVELLVEIAQALPDGCARVLLAGHNPGLAQLVLLLARPEVARGPDYPPGTLAELCFEVERWGDLVPGTARLVRFVRPRELDPALV